MKIRDLFRKPVDRPIEGVIKADDDRYLQTELEEYVITRDVAKGLGIFTERYLDEMPANGVWISGFFGSGKSHLLKILSHVLDSTPLDSGQRASEIILPKIDDEIIQANLRKAAAVPSRSILFNIDQKYDGIGGNNSAAILEVFVKVLNELQGYYAKQGYVAWFERELDIRDELQAFKDTYQRINGSTWEDDRGAIAIARKGQFARAYAAHTGESEEAAAGHMRQVREDYRVSVESFAQMVKGYIDRQPAGFRLNFFVDEVGQFIGQDSARMLNLQTLAETLGTVCAGRAWIFVTSQADIEGVLGNFRGLEGHDISKIMGRFKTQITLASADVREVIQCRLLAKTEDEPEVLTTIWDREKENLQTLFRFGDNSINLHGWRGSDEFCALYPFHPYQFDLFQVAIQQLSRHNAFTGRYQSVGERSMLAVFQEVAKSVRDQEVGTLATFDLMYDGIAASMRGDFQNGIQRAERQLGKGLPIRILKALFLLKWVREFKASPRNIAILLIDRPDIDIRDHEKAVREALNQLESQSYLQRNNELYEFLTEVEKDIEVEIKNTEIDDSRVADLLGQILFTDVLRDPKVRYEGNAQDYAYERKLDDVRIGREQDIAIHVVTTDHPNHGDLGTLAAQNTGRAELLAVLPSDTRFIDQARLFLKTQKYVQQNAGTGDESRKVILDQRGQQNSLRRSALQDIAGELLASAPLFVNGSRLDTPASGDARNRLLKGCQQLISFAYPSLRMLKGTYDESTLSKTLLDPDDLFSGGTQTPTEAEQEILNYVLRNQEYGERTTVEAMARHFGKRPYGWPLMAVLTLIARVFRMGKVELRTDELLDGRRALEALRNSRQHASIRVRMQQQFDAAQVTALKNFHQDFFDQSSKGTDARSAGEELLGALKGEVRDLDSLLDQIGRYPFLAPLRAIRDRVAALSERDYTAVLNELDSFHDDLLTAKEDLLSPIKAFMRGAQRAAYDEALAFLKEQEANFAEMPEADVKPLRDLAAAEHPYRGRIVPEAKAAVSRLADAIQAALQAERDKALALLDQHQERVLSSPEAADLSDAERSQVLAAGLSARSTIESAGFVSGIRDRIQRYINFEYPAQLALVGKLAATRTQPDDGGGAPKPPPPPVEYTKASDLRPHFTSPFLATEADLDQWLEALRKAASDEIAKGRRIIL